MFRLITGIFLPHQHNNFKAKLLHKWSLLTFIGLFLMAQSTISLTSQLKPGVLGYASFISTVKVVELTNLERSKAGLPNLKINPELSQAAQSKAADMIKRGYWSHNTPDGKEPWIFISQSGYSYLHAGENLARDYSSAESAVSAWMNSGSHRANMLNPNYQDIGVAVVEGRVRGVETTFIVQMFGKPQTSKSKITSIQTSGAFQQVLAAGSVNLISPFDLSRSISLSFLLLIIATLTFDWLIVWRRNIIRLSGKNWAHLTFAGTLTIILLLIKQGWIL